MAKEREKCTYFLHTKETPATYGQKCMFCHVWWKCGRYISHIPSLKKIFLAGLFDFGLRLFEELESQEGKEREGGQEILPARPTTRSHNKLPIEPRCGNFVTKHRLSVPNRHPKRAKMCMQRVRIPAGHPFCMPPLVVGHLVTIFGTTPSPCGGQVLASRWWVGLSSRIQTDSHTAPELPESVDFASLESLHQPTQQMNFANKGLIRITF